KEYSKLTANEMLSLVQIKTVLAKRDLFFIYPQFVSIREYLELFLPLKITPVLIEDQYFGDYKRANKLGVSPDLYMHFTAYEYMLIHHIDAYVFSDQLDYWCSQGLDYIGAPWFAGNNRPSFPLRFTGVGNGGFSLRKIKSFLDISYNRSFVNLHIGLSQVYDFLEGEGHKMVRRFLFINSFMKIIEPLAGYEDEFWGLTVPKFHRWFKVAKPEQAMRFSFEVMPRELFRLNNNELPFGCHAWEKYDPVFWESYIHADFGMKLESDGDYDTRESNLNVG
ncbi:MAG TPA: DUF5672 family protein, partial [Flavitalea sp.]|nr:DUF5672 family protein [Flavitalea sp.]